MLVEFEVDGFACLVLSVELAEVGDAPAAPCARVEALGDEGGDGRVFSLEIGADFAQRDVEAEADIGVGVHRSDGRQHGLIESSVCQHLPITQRGNRTARG